jgi:hypothetical protein
MHQTTVRFGSDLWEALEREAGELGVSVAQYVRDAALLRLGFDAGRRGDVPLEAVLDGRRTRAWPPSAVDSAQAARERATDNLGSSLVLQAQSDQALHRARELRDSARRRRRADGGEASNGAVRLTD